MQRRRFLQYSGSLCGGLSLSSILAQRAAAGAERRDTAVIFVTLGGGAAQHETYDPKPDAPVEYRGEFRSIATAVPGVAFCELLPRQAQLADRLAIVRSITHHEASHIAEHVVESGYFLQNPANSLRGEMPSVGSVVARTRGATRPGLPAWATIPERRAYSTPAYLGRQFGHFAINDDPAADGFHVANLDLPASLPVERLEDRQSLRQAFDTARATAAYASESSGLDAFARQAFDFVTSPHAREAFDIGTEPAAVRDRYGRNAFGQRLLLARRLVAAGMPFVVVRTFDWDDHEELPRKIRDRAPIFDQGIATLIGDLHERGLARQVLVVAMGEFGRTPKVNAKAGRDHWPAVASVLLAGGDYRMGQVVGATDDRGAAVTAAPYPPQSVLAMVYRHLGIDPGLTFPDFTGRPRAILESRESIRELT